jgi:hypothetical protein
MPYLHWDIKDQLDKREEVVAQKIPGARVEDAGWNRDQKLVDAYLCDKHPLHIRRTLDQYYYHTLKDTRKRDLDQVVSRYQKDMSPKSRVLTMVDQLWLWVLHGPDGRPETVVTCFPQRDAWKQSEDPDEHGYTDVLRHIKLHLLTDPSSVRHAYDLAGLIASKCSRAYLDIGSVEERLRFPEIYEIAVGDVVSTCLAILDERVH